MRRSCLAIALGLVLLLEAPLAALFAHAPFAISVVQQTSCRGDDVTCTFPGSPNGSNHILVALYVNSKANTVGITGITPTEDVLHDAGDHPTEALRSYVFCWQADAGDTTFVATSSASGTMSVAAVEFSGGSCTEDGTSAHNPGTGTSHSATVTTSSSGSLLIGLVASTTVTNFTAVGGGCTTGIPSSLADIAAGDNAGVGVGCYGVLGAGGAYNTDFTSAASEVTLTVAAAVQAAGGGASAPRSLLLLGVGGK